MNTQTAEFKVAGHGKGGGEHTSSTDDRLIVVFVTQAELAGRDFAAQRDADVIVISTGAVEAKPEQSEEARQEAERRNRHRWVSNP
jgi:hypothetical protein